MPTVVESGGCIRLYPADPTNTDNPGPRPEWHIDENHVTIGLFDTSRPPRIDSAGYLVIDLVNPDGSGVNTWPVIRMDAEEDETLVSRHITAGPSNGGPIMRIRLTHKDLGDLDLTRSDHYAICSGKFSNIWAGAKHLQP